jgi:hypothetical protein
MTLRTPPSWLQQGSHPAENDRLTMQAIFTSTGIIGSGSLAVSANSPAGMSVVVASGWAAILGNYQSNMGVYTAYNDASIVGTITTANASNPRIDLVCLTVNDAYYTGSLNNVALNVVAGTPSATPSAPATPTNSIALAQVYVGAAVTQINTGNITDVRTTAGSNFVTPSGTATLTNKTSAGEIFQYPYENWYINATAFAGYTAYLVTNTSAVHYLTTNSTANGTLNITSSSGVTLNSIMSVGQTITFSLLVTNGSSAYYPNAFQVDGSAVTPKWSGGTAPSAGNASAVDVYQFSILKTASATFTVFASGPVKYA